MFLRLETCLNNVSLVLDLISAKSNKPSSRTSFDSLADNGGREECCLTSSETSI